MQEYDSKEERSYSFKDRVYDEDIDYSRNFGFIDLDNIANPEKFAY